MGKTTHQRRRRRKGKQGEGGQTPNLQDRRKYVRPVDRHRVLPGLELYRRVDEELEHVVYRVEGRLDKRVEELLEAALNHVDKHQKCARYRVEARLEYVDKRVAYLLERAPQLTEEAVDGASYVVGERLEVLLQQLADVEHIA